jgi:hypothetical protein
MELDRIAASRGSAIDTIRSQLKNVLSKTSTRRQAELVALIASTAKLQTKASRYVEYQLDPVRCVAERLHICYKLSPSDTVPSC